MSCFSTFSFEPLEVNTENAQQKYSDGNKVQVRKSNAMHEENTENAQQKKKKT